MGEKEKHYEEMKRLMSQVIKNTTYTAGEIQVAWKSIFPQLGLNVKEW